MQNNDDRDELARKNRRLVRILSSLLVAGFVYPMWMNARNVLIDGTLQWGSLIGALFFVLPMLLPVYAFFFYDGYEGEGKPTKDKTATGRKVKRIIAVVFGLVFFGAGIGALWYSFHPSTMSAHELHSLDGTVCKVFLYRNPKGNDQHTSVQLCETPGISFFIPYYDSELQEGWRVRFMIKEQDYLRVTGQRSLTSRERHTQDQYRPKVYAYSTDSYDMPLELYNQMKEKDTVWALLIGVFLLLIGIVFEVILWSEELYRYATDHNLRLLQRVTGSFIRLEKR